VGWCGWRTENEPGPNQTAETTKALLSAPGPFFFFHSGEDTRVRTQHTNTLGPIIIPPIFSDHSITISSSPSSCNPVFSHSTSRLSPITFYLPLHFSPPPSFLVMIRPFSSRHTSLIPSLSTSLYSFSFIPHPLNFRFTHIYTQSSWAGLNIPSCLTVCISDNTGGGGGVIT